MKIHEGNGLNIFTGQIFALDTAVDITENCITNSGQFHSRQRNEVSNTYHRTRKVTPKFPHL